MPDLIADIRRRVAEMRREADELEKALATIISLVGAGPGQGSAGDSPYRPRRRPRGNASLIASAIRGAGGQLSTAGIVDAMLVGVPLTYRNKTSARSSAIGLMRRRPEVFRKVDLGVWALIQEGASLEPDAAADPDD